ncbi:MAG: hypothetical protein IMX02_06685 [Limnochordaceae bacterium]|nr:hypothetical protein [Limnochordaceae bacterium]
MSPATALSELHRRGVIVRAEGNAIRVIGSRDAPSPELIDTLQAHNVAVPELLAWPPASWEAEARYGVPHARLYPFLGRKVRTPAGRAGCFRCPPT